jgi:hypothetical protein
VSPWGLPSDTISRVFMTPIADGKLYVFSDKKGVPLFEQQTASIVEKVAKNWPELRNRP